MSNCIFCKIVSGSIPCFKVFESPRVLAFMDINPISKGHILVIPKQHAQFMHQMDDDSLQEILPVSKRIVEAAFDTVSVAYSVLQNNGRLAHQEVEHVHFHLIPKTVDAGGLEIDWNVRKQNMDEVKALADEIHAKLSN